MAIGFYILTFYIVYFVFKISFISRISFLLNYILFYLFIFILLIVINLLLVKNKSADLEEFEESFKLYGINIKYLLSRTGIVYIDFIGLLSSFIFTITSALFKEIQFLIPFFILTGISFLFAITTGTTKPWILRKK